MELHQPVDSWAHHGPGPLLRDLELRLRPPWASDLILAAGWWADEAVCFGFQTEPGDFEEIAAAWRETAEEARERGECEVRWVIEAGSRPVGLLWLSLWAVDKGEADLSILIGDPACRGRGLGPRAIALAAGWAFQALALRRLWISPRADHAAAIAAYRKAGCVEDGLEPRSQTWRGQEVWTLRMFLTPQALERCRPALSRPASPRP